MKSIRVLITGAGAPGILGTIFSLQNNYDKRKIEIIGTDVQEEVVGKYLCDKFFKIPKASLKEEYLKALLNICKNESIDVILPQNTSELLTLAQSKEDFRIIGTQIVVSDDSAIDRSNNKFHLMKVCERVGVPVGKFQLVNNCQELKKFAVELGWPQKRIVIKPPISNGMRGVRVIDESFDPKKSFFDEKPSSMIDKMDNLLSILGETFPDLIVTEYLPGDEYTVDIFRSSKKAIIIPRKRDLIRTGITFNSTVIRNEEIIKYSTILANELNLNYCFGFQFKLDDQETPKILESNPRIQGTMVMSTIAGANIIYSSVKEVLGESIPEISVNWNSRILRYWGGIGLVENNVIKL